MDPCFLFCRGVQDFERIERKLQKQGKLYTSEEQLGYNMEKLIEEFSGHASISNMTSCKNLVRVFQEQFVNMDRKAESNPHPSGKVLLNPSDPDAEIGHKGPGYQVQIAETCSDKNDVQLEVTYEFKKRYGSKRCPIEGLNGRLKQFTHLRRLRIRVGNGNSFETPLSAKILSLHIRGFSNNIILSMIYKHLPNSSESRPDMNEEWYHGGTIHAESSKSAP